VTDPILTARNLNKTYRRQGARPPLQVLRDVSFDLHAGETLGVVGESGSGKSTLARVLLRLTDVDSGSIRYRGIDLLNPSGQQSRELRRKIQIVFQDPNSSMNPRRTVRQALVEAARVSGDPEATTDRALVDMLDAVGLSSDKLNALPHHLSGGQRQRVAIARALAVNPEIIVADECVSALDVSVQSAILNLMLDLQRSRGIAYIFIGHDLSVVHHMSDRIMVMQKGEVVETGDPADVLRNPSHPYVRELIESAPGLHR
jgi:peptide/nickel transport system ATP-binding protein